MAHEIEQRGNGSEVFLQDILISIEKINSYLGTPPPEDTLQDDKSYDAIIRNLEVIGEAIENIPYSFRDSHAEVEWEKFVELQEMLIREYFDIDDAVILDVLKNGLPDLYLRVEKMVNPSHEENGKGE
jgi:uncharacterized protein with HEPN domain